MNKRQLTRSASIAPIMLGGNVFGWTADEAMSHRILDRFVERGFNAIDTADTYLKEGGESETVIGNWLKKRGRRNDVVIATKVGYWGKRPGLSRGNIEAAIDDSLRRLQTDYVDVYFAHLWDDKVPIEETLAAFGRLVDAGKVRAIGASNYSAAQLSASLAASEKLGLPRYQTLQPLYNLSDRQVFEAELRDVALQKQISVVPFFALASGFLSGKYRSDADLEGQNRGGMVKRHLTSRGMRILDALDKVATETGTTPAKVAIAWLIARPAITAPIVSATNIAQLDDVLDAADLDLSAEAMALLTEASAED